MMKKLVVSLIALLSVSSCSDDYLERGSLTQLAAGTFWQTEADAQLGINGIYDVLQDRVMYGGNLNANAGLPQYDGMSDNVFNNYKFEGPGLFMEANVTPATAFFTSVWAAHYRGIGRANAAIENIEKIQTIAPEAKARLLGQAYFLRALFYMNLAVYFEEVPLVLTVQSLQESYVPKNTFQEVRQAINADLDKAIASLPVSLPAAQFGYATKGAALGLAARWYLYNKEYQKVVDLTNEMMTMGYSLNSDYAQLFTTAGEQSREIVFSIRFVQDQTNNNETFSATFEGIPRVNDQPMPNLVDDFYCTDGLPINRSPLYAAANRKNNRDPRLTASIYFQGDIFLLHLNRAFNGNTATRFGRKKYTRNTLSPEGIGVFSPGGQDFYLIRYADVLLMRAEALAELGQHAAAYPLVNQVRARVKMPSIEQVEGTNLSKDQLLEVIRHERRVELALEGLRFFDLKRWGRIQQGIQKADADPVAGYNPQYVGRRSEVFPIPQTELDANPKLVQNPAWQ